MNNFKVLLQDKKEVRSLIIRANDEKEAFFKLSPKQRTQVLGITKLWRPNNTQSKYWTTSTFYRSPLPRSAL